VNKVSGAKYAYQAEQERPDSQSALLFRESGREPGGQSTLGV